MVKLPYQLTQNAAGPAGPRRAAAQSRDSGPAHRPRPHVIRSARRLVQFHSWTAHANFAWDRRFPVNMEKTDPGGGAKGGGE